MNPTEIIKQPDGKFTVKLAPVKEGGNEVEIKDNDQVVLATGRGAKTKGLGLEEVGVELGEWLWGLGSVGIGREGLKKNNFNVRVQDRKSD